LTAQKFPSEKKQQQGVHNAKKREKMKGGTGGKPAKSMANQSEPFVSIITDDQAHKKDGAKLRMGASKKK